MRINHACFIHALYIDLYTYIMKMMKGIFRTRMPREPRRSYPCPIFSKRLYFFLGSPTLSLSLNSRLHCLSPPSPNSTCGSSSSTCTAGWRWKGEQGGCTALTLNTTDSCFNFKKDRILCWCRKNDWNVNILFYKTFSGLYSVMRKFIYQTLAQRGIIRLGIMDVFWRSWILCPTVCQTVTRWVSLCGLLRRDGLSVQNTMGSGHDTTHCLFPLGLKWNSGEPLWNLPVSSMFHSQQFIT